MSNCVENPWLSVVIPIYNAEKYLSECLRSILNQTFENFELILVDDGSSDASGEICKAFLAKDSRVKYFCKENGGSLQTRIFGAEKASGKYIIFCDADDYYFDENSFEIINNHLKNDEYDFIQFGIVNKFPYAKKSKEASHSLSVEKKDFYEYDYPILLCSFFERSRLTGNVWNKVYKRELFENLPDSKDIGKIFMGDDFIMNMYLLKNIGKALYISDQLYVYRNILGGSGKFRKNEIESINVLKEYQWMFLQEWDGECKDKVVRMHFAETSGWLYAHVQDSLEHLGEEEIKEMILNALNIPNVKKAREYLRNNTEDYPEFKLLVAGDPDLYISEAKRIIENRPIKLKIKIFAKKILRKFLK